MGTSLFVRLYGYVSVYVSAGASLWVRLYGYISMGTSLWVRLYGYVSMGTSLWGHCKFISSQSIVVSTFVKLLYNLEAKNVIFFQCIRCHSTRGLHKMNSW